MDLHRFWDGVIISSQNLSRLRNEATVLRNRQEFQRSQLTELGNTDFESWARRASRLQRSLLISAVGGLGAQEPGIGIAAAPMLPAGYVVNASRIADRRMILAAYRLAHLLRRVCRQLGKKRFRLATTTVPKQKRIRQSLVLLGEKTLTTPQYFDSTCTNFFAPAGGGILPERMSFAATDLP